jgi:NAD(P)-dependent dehydrogenase (short-subunit alcohol dehydrogenase family)
MQINGATALVTGANRGLGRHLAQQLRDRGAIVYAAARQPDQVDLPGVTPIALDITDPVSLATAVQAAKGVSILVNNAGSSTGASLLKGDLADIRLEMDTHYFGTLAVVRAFAPEMAAHEQSAILNVLSVLSWISFPDAGAYLRGQVGGVVTNQRATPTRYAKSSPVRAPGSAQSTSASWIPT